MPRVDQRQRTNSSRRRLLRAGFVSAVERLEKRVNLSLTTIPILPFFNETGSLSDVVHLGDRSDLDLFIPKSTSGTSKSFSFDIPPDLPPFLAGTVSIKIDQYQADNSNADQRSFVVLNDTMLMPRFTRDPRVFSLTNTVLLPANTDTFLVDIALLRATNTLVIHSSHVGVGIPDTYDDFCFTNVRLVGEVPLPDIAVLDATTEDFQTFKFEYEITGTTVPAFGFQAYMSTDETLDDADMPLGLPLEIGGEPLQTDVTAPRTYPAVLTLDNRAPVSVNRRFVLIVADAAATIDESDEGNNDAFAIPIVPVRNAIQGLPSKVAPAGTISRGTSAKEREVSGGLVARIPRETAPSILARIGGDNDDNRLDETQWAPSNGPSETLWPGRFRDHDGQEASNAPAAQSLQLRNEDHLVNFSLIEPFTRFVRLIERDRVHFPDGWGGWGNLSINEAYDSTDGHDDPNSLHYVGRAMDINLKPADPPNPHRSAVHPRLAGLAFLAGFAYSWNEAADHIHISTRGADVGLNGTVNPDSYTINVSGDTIHVHLNTDLSNPPTHSLSLLTLGSVEMRGNNGDDVFNFAGDWSSDVVFQVHGGSGNNQLSLQGPAARIDSIVDEGGTLAIVAGNGSDLVTSGFGRVSLALEGEGTTATILPGGQASVLTSLAVGDGAALDIADNALVYDYAGTSPVSTVREKILSGRGGAGLGAGWHGAGITSAIVATSNAVEPEKWSVGYAENAALPVGPYTSFRGVAVDATSVLIAYTRTGDANLDGVVNDDDVTILGATYAPGVPNAHWAMGDFDYNGFVDDDDVTLLGAFYERTAALTLPSPRHGESQATGGRGVLDAAAGPQPVSGGGVSGEGLAKYEVQITKDEIGAGAAGRETFGPGHVRGQETPAQQASALTLPSPDLPSVGNRRGVSDGFAAPQSPDVGALTPAFTNGRGVNQTARQAGALTLPSPIGRGIGGNRDDEILVDLLAESFVAQAAGRGANLYETGLPLRLAVSGVMALWTA